MGETDRTQLVPIRTVTRVVWTVTVVALALFLAVFALGRVVEIEAIKGYVDLGGESNLPTWWSTALLLGVALGAAGARRLATEAAVRRAWTLVAAAAALLSLDEATQLHERLRHLEDVLPVDAPTYAWVLPGAVVAAVGLTVLVLVGRALPSPVRGRLLVAAAVFVTGALGFEALGGYVAQDGHDLVFSLVLLVEEGLEMAGASLALLAVVRHLDLSAPLPSETAPAGLTVASGR